MSTLTLETPRPDAGAGPRSPTTRGAASGTSSVPAWMVGTDLPTKRLARILECSVPRLYAWTRLAFTYDDERIEVLNARPAAAAGSSSAT